MLAFTIHGKTLVILDTYPFCSVIEDVAELSQTINEILAAPNEVVVVEQLFGDSDEYDFCEHSSLWLTHVHVSLNEPIPLVPDPALPSDLGPMGVLDPVERRRDPRQDVDLPGG